MVRNVKHGKYISVLVLASITVLSACGGGGSSAFDPQNKAPLSGNWQFTTFQTDGTFLGGMQGGFLLQKNGSVSGQVAYSISSPSTTGGNPTLCNSGSATINGTISGQNVNLTAVAATQTFTLTGTLSSDGLTLNGTYSSTAGAGPARCASPADRSDACHSSGGIPRG